MPRGEFLGIVAEALAEADVSWWPDQLSSREIVEARENGMWDVYVYVQLLDERAARERHVQPRAALAAAALAAHDARQPLGRQDQHAAARGGAW